MDFRVIIVEDDFNARRNWEIVCENLAVEGFAPDCKSASEFYKAIKRILEEIQTCDVFVLDLNLDGESGEGGGKGLWEQLKEEGMVHGCELLVSSQRVIGKELDEFLAKWKAHYCSSIDQYRKQEKLNDVLEQIKKKRNPSG